MLSFSSEHFQLEFYTEKSTKLHGMQNVKKKFLIVKFSIEGSVDFNSRKIL